jgi:hypothetical protein
VVNHKFKVPVEKLGADLEVLATQSGKPFPVSGLIVLGKGLCESNSNTVCIEKPVIGKSSITVRNGTGDALPKGQYTLLLNKGTSRPDNIEVQYISAHTNADVPVRALTTYDSVELDYNGVPANVIGPLMARSPDPPPPCSEKSATLPCLKAVKTTDKSMTGFAVPKSTVDIKIGDTDKGNPPVDGTGKFNVDLPSLAKGQKITVTQTNPPPEKGAEPKSDSVTVTDAPASDSTIALYTLGLAGLNVAGTSNSGPTQQYFVSFDTRLPLPFLGRSACASPDEDYVMDYKCWLWINPRIASAPAPASTTLKSFSSVGALTSGIGGETLGQIAQTLEFHSGMEYSLFHGPHVPTSSTSAFRGVFSLILGGGIVTPINSTSDASIFVLNANLGNQFTENSLLANNSPQSFANTYPALAAALCSHFGYTSTPACTPSAVTYGNVAFVLPNRSRFYRDYFAGIRLRTYFFSGDCSKKNSAVTDGTPSSCKVANIHPGSFDIRFGQDETVTGGYFRGITMTSTASYPLPGTSGAVRIFGSTYLSLNRNKNTQPLALVASSSTIPITDPSVVIQPITASNQDYYRIGLAADLIPIIAKWVNPKSNSGGSDTSTPSQ